MSRRIYNQRIAKYFTNLAAPEPDADDFVDLHKKIRSVMRIDPDDIYDFGTDMINDMADTMLDDILYLDDDQQEVFLEVYAGIMKDVEHGFHYLLNTKIFSGNADNDDVWEQIETSLNTSLNNASIKITYAALTLAYMPAEEHEYFPEDFMEEPIDPKESQLWTEWYDAFLPQMYVMNDEVLDFIKYRSFAEDMIDDVVMNLRGVATKKEQSQIRETVRANINAVRDIFLKEYMDHKRSKDHLPTTKALVKEWGANIRATMHEACANIVDACYLIGEKKLDQKPPQINLT